MTETLKEFISRRMYEIEASGASEYLTGQIVAYMEIKQKLKSYESMAAVSEIEYDFIEHCWYCRKPIEPVQSYGFHNDEQEWVKAHKDCRIWILERNEWLRERE